MHDVNKSTDSYDGLKSRLLIIVLLLNLLVYCLAGLSLYQSRMKYEKQAAVSTQNIANVLDRNIKGEIDRIDMALIAMKNEAEGQMSRGGIDKEVLNRYITRMHSYLPSLSALRMTNSKGDLIYGTGLTPGTNINIADRDYFNFEREKFKGEVFISKPILGRVINRWVINIARRVNNPDGSYAGVVFGTLTLEHLIKLFSSIEVGEKGSISLRDAQLALIARYPELRDTIGSQTVSKEFSELFNAGNKNATYIGRAGIDRIERLITYRKIPDYPLVIVVALAKDEFLVDWIKEAMVQFVLVAIFTLVTIFSTRMMLTRWIREKKKDLELRKAKEELELRIEERTTDLNQANDQLKGKLFDREQADKALRESEERLRAILQTAMDGFWLVDMNGRLLEVNETYCRMSGYNAQELLAMHIFDLDATESLDNTADRIHMIMALGEGRFEVQHRRKDGSIMDVEVSVQYKPVEGGRLISFLRDITARKQTEVALRESEFFFKESQRAASIGSYKADFASDYWESSEVLDTIFGIDKEYDRSVQGWLDIVHPGDSSMLDRHLKEEVISKRKPFSKEYRIIRKNDGETRWVNGLGAATFDRNGNVTTLIGTIQDITERKQAEEGLLLFKESVENSTDAIGMASPEGKHIYQNKSFTNMFDEFGDDPPDLFVDDSVGKEMFNTVMNGGQWVGEVKMYAKNKKVLDIHLRSYANKDANGRIIGLVGIHTDITERKRSEEERINLEKQLLHAQKLESLGILAGGIAHDFNNTLTAIIGNADLALMRINKESPATENLHRIEQAAAQAADLARQMLAYSGKGKFVVENIGLNHLLEDMLHMLEVSISKKAVLRLNLQKHLPTVEADATQMRQIVMNLVINASEAIGEKSGVIAISTGSMDCDKNYFKNVWLDENIIAGLYVYLEIADTGCGMDKETMAKLFDPFFTTKFTGRGLGMAAVLGIVRGHKGAIKVYSEPKKGTTFKVLLPASNRPPEIINGESHNDDWHGSGTVLLVDDEDTVRGIVKEMLQELGFAVITADDGREAAEIYKTTHDIDFVILDLTMPHMDGEQCFRELRRINTDVKVIMSSGYNEQEVTQKFVGKGLAGFIQKPYKLSVLKAAIRGL